MFYVMFSISRPDELLGSAVHILPTMVFQSGNTSLPLK